MKMASYIIEELKAYAIEVGIFENKFDGYDDEDWLDLIMQSNNSGEFINLAHAKERMADRHFPQMENQNAN